ncbi:hypothetical protein FNB79_00860 [Formosa sediminum]|uniref:Uncharacterized protein n=1 Tax=Formosa sediminum TaxID=2594004 RepID=A0A516GM42_9FLAO|nr:hypothetical protein [Formosa sediminum]QDO92589.1 hypothetical protein FNB79_00860 [Formosa sediminum]
MKTLLKLLSITALIVLWSCGYKNTEKDKHPDLPIFPEHTNNKINIKPFPFITTDLYYNTDYIFANTDNGELRILDRNFKTINQLAIQVDLKSITNQGDIYNIETKGDNIKTLKSVYKLSSENNFKPEKLEIKTVFARSFHKIRDSLTTHLKEKSKTYIDSMYTLEIEKDKQKTLAKLTEIIEHVDAMVHLEHIEVDILKYKNKDVALYSNLLFFDELEDIKKKKYLPTVQRITHMQKSPISFDKVVLDNSYSGNHLVGGFTPIGYNYIALKVDNQTTKFKIKNADNGDGIHILNTSKDTIILNDNTYQLFYATVKK